MEQDTFQSSTVQFGAQSCLLQLPCTGMHPFNLRMKPFDLISTMLLSNVAPLLAQTLRNQAWPKTERLFSSVVVGTRGSHGHQRAAYGVA